MRGRIVAVTVAATFGVACSGTSHVEPTTTAAATEHMAVTVTVDGLDHPTQIADGPGGVLPVAQLAGDENDGTGEVLVVDNEPARVASSPADLTSRPGCCGTKERCG